MPYTKNQVKDAQMSEKIKLYNSLTKQKENLVTIEKNKVSMYVCGPTVYDFLHIGNARPLVVFDTVRRYLQHAGYSVTYVQNFTDVDDKIIKRANEQSVTMDVISQKYINEALHDMQGLNVMEPTHTPKVTNEITEIIQMIQTLISSNNAYEINGNVYFYAPSDTGYGRLKNIDTDNLQTRLDDSDIGITKKHPTDFVLWKAKKDGEPYYDSPWGQGRPGWHIECSAMIKKYLGTTIDIHAGGIDLLFPHHENEIAQSQCANHAPLANYFMHNGFINIDNEKMAKSAGNFFTIRDVADKFGYDTLRFFLLSAHYRSAINYSDELLQASKVSLGRIRDCVLNLEFLIKNHTSGDTVPTSPNFVAMFNNAMADDFNTALASSAIFEYVKFANSNINETTALPSIQKAHTEITTLCDILGIQLQNKTNDLAQEVENLITQRETARKQKDFAKADDIRNQLTNMGITLEDTRQGVRWKLND